MTLATAVTAVIAVTVLRAPSERVFGTAIAGPHHDPFTVMAQFEGAPRSAMYWQPVTDIPGGLIARIAGGVAAYNWIVLLSFPLTAVAAFLLARHLSLSPAGATLAAMACAFAPFHIAHAAYHPHIAQVQWIPLYLLALWRCLDRASLTAIAFLVAATAAVTLSNFYGGLIAAVITPVAVGAYVFRRRGASTRPARDLAVTLSALAAVAVAGVAYVVYLAPAVVTDRATFAFPASDLVRYSATVWSFLTPPVAHPLFGAAAARVWETAGVRDGVVEQQVYLGWSLIGLALIAIVGWLVDRRGYVPVLAGVAAIALYFAMSPPAWLYHALPMFRSYARFGVVVQLMAALVAGIGFDRLWRGAKWPLRTVAATLAVLLVGEYAVSPRAMSRDVLQERRAVIEQARSIPAPSAPTPGIYTAAMTGFSPREQNRLWSWRWMGAGATWTVRNTTPAPVLAFLDLEVSAFHNVRHLEMQFDGADTMTIEVVEERLMYRLGPFVVTPGDHALTFRPVELPSVADTALHNGDTRSLSFAIGAWHWSTEGTK